MDNTLFSLNVRALFYQMSLYICVELPSEVYHVQNVMAHAQKPDLVFQGNGRVHLNRRGCQFSRLLAVEECGSAGSDCIDRVPTYSARLLATHSIRIFPLHFSSRASPCAIRFRTSSFILCCSVTGRDTQLTATGAQDSYCYMRQSTYCSRDKHLARPLTNKMKY